MNLNETRINSASEFEAEVSAYRTEERKSAPPGDAAREKRLAKMLDRLNGHASRLRSIRGSCQWNSAAVSPEHFERLVATSAALQRHRSQLKKMQRSDPAG